MPPAVALDFPTMDMDKGTCLAGHWQLQGGAWAVRPLGPRFLYSIEETSALGTTTGILADGQNDPNSPKRRIFVGLKETQISYSLFYDFKGVMSGMGYLNKQPVGQVSIRWTGPLSP
jgi:hypothetical protein